MYIYRYVNIGIYIYTPFPHSPILIFNFCNSMRGSCRAGSLDISAQLTRWQGGRASLQNQSMYTHMGLIETFWDISDRCHWVDRFLRGVYLFNLIRSFIAEVTHIIHHTLACIWIGISPSFLLLHLMDVFCDSKCSEVLQILDSRLMSSVFALAKVCFTAQTSSKHLP